MEEAPPQSNSLVGKFVCALKWKIVARRPKKKVKKNKRKEAKETAGTFLWLQLGNRKLCEKWQAARLSRFLHSFVCKNSFCPIFSSGRQPGIQGARWSLNVLRVLRTEQTDRINAPAKTEFPIGNWVSAATGNFRAMEIAIPILIRPI